MASAFNFDDIARYTEVEYLGRGDFGTVYKVENWLGEEFAMKLIPIPPISYRKTIDREAGLLKSLSHPNIVALYSWKILAEGSSNYFNIPWSFENPNNNEVLSLRMELCDCDVASKLNSRTRISDTWNRNIFKQIVKGVQYLHRNDVIHRDLKPANVLLKGGTAKLTDFGIAKGGVFSWNAEHTSGRGTRRYMAPEVRSGIYDKTVDIYSLGIILLEFYTDSNYFMQWDGDLSGGIWDNTSCVKYYSIIKRMTGHSSNRPTLSEIISSIE